MKKKNLTLTMLTILLFISTMSYSQISMWDKTSHATYKPLSPNEILMPAMIMKQQYDNNAAKVDALIESIFKLKEQTDDEEFLEAIDKQYQKLKKFYDMDLARMDKQIRVVQLEIMEEVDKYNRKLKKKETTPKKKDTSNLRGYQKVYDHSPILEEPNMSAKQIGVAVNGVVDVLGPYDENFYLVISDTIKGYIWIGWFK